MNKSEQSCNFSTIVMILPLSFPPVIHEHISGTVHIIFGFNKIIKKYDDRTGMTGILDFESCWYMLVNTIKWFYVGITTNDMLVYLNCNIRSNFAHDNKISLVMYLSCLSPLQICSRTRSSYTPGNGMKLKFSKSKRIVMC